MSTMIATRRSRARRSPVSETPIRAFVRFVFYLALGAALGLGSVWYVLTNGISLDRVDIGPWSMRMDAGQPIADPYTSAFVARSGHIPVRIDGAIYLYAATTDAGAPLDGACAYAVSGTAPAAAWWSVSLHDPAGGLVANTARRYSFSSTTTLIDDGGTFRIAVGPNATPGNWLPTGGGGPFRLLFRIHAPDPKYLRDPRAIAVPAIGDGVCR